MTDRRTSGSGRLIRLGFQDLDRARRLLESPRLQPLLSDEDVDGDMLADLGASADPDTALLLFVRILESGDERQWHRLVSALQADADLRRRLADVIGMSEALGDFLAQHPEEWHVLADAEALAAAPLARDMRAELLTAVGADPNRLDPVAAGAGTPALDALRVTYRRILLGIAARDISGLADMDTVASWLSDLADSVLEAALAVARAEVGPPAEQCVLAVIGMGKCGGARTQLRQRRRRHLRRGGAGRRRRVVRARRRHCPRHGPDARVHRRHGGGNDLGGRCGPSARRQAGSTRAHDRLARGLLRALGEDVGVPGAAEDAPGRGRPRTRPALRRCRQPVRLERRRPPRFRRRRPGDAPSGGAACARSAGRARAQARAWRAQGRGVLRPAAATGPRPQ